MEQRASSRQSQRKEVAVQEACKVLQKKTKSNQRAKDKLRAEEHVAEDCKGRRIELEERQEEKRQNESKSYKKETSQLSQRN